jgi:hypothetical protein
MIQISIYGGHRFGSTLYAVLWIKRLGKEWRRRTGEAGTILKD